MNQIEMVDTLSTNIINSLDGKPTDVAVMSCIQSAVKILKASTGLTTIGVIDVLIDCLSKMREDEDKIPL